MIVRKTCNQTYSLPLLDIIMLKKILGDQIRYYIFEKSKRVQYCTGIAGEVTDISNKEQLSLG